MFKRTGGPKTFKNMCLLKKKQKTAFWRNIKGKAGTAPGTQTGSAGGSHEADCPHPMGPEVPQWETRASWTSPPSMVGHFVGALALIVPHEDCKGNPWGLNLGIRL